MSTMEDERLHTEISLVEAMYPDQVAFIEKAREVKLSLPEGSLQLRLPDGYLIDQLPEVLSAASAKQDLREELKCHIESCHVGEECLDSIVFAFKELCKPLRVDNPPAVQGEMTRLDNTEQGPGRITTIIWLHHLLNTSKRKQALSPASPAVSGITKPGRPGVLVYSGPANAVHSHVRELKQLNWAFQVRMECEDEWHFAHGPGMKEVETMKDAVDEVGDEKKEMFMEAVMRMK